VVFGDAGVVGSKTMFFTCVGVVFCPDREISVDCPLSNTIAAAQRQIEKK